MLQNRSSKQVATQHNLFIGITEEMTSSMKNTPNILTTLYLSMVVQHMLRVSKRLKSMNSGDRKNFWQVLAKSLNHCNLEAISLSNLALQQPTQTHSKTSVSSMPTHPSVSKNAHLLSIQCRPSLCQDISVL